MFKYPRIVLKTNTICSLINNKYEKSTVSRKPPVAKNVVFPNAAQPQFLDLIQKVEKVPPLS